MARHTPGNYVPLDVNYARDLAVRRAGTNAELLYIRSLAYAKGARTSGFVSDFDLEVVAVGMRSVKAAAEKLVEVGLWVRVTDGWLIRSWERWNTEEKAASAGGKLGNHVRWHVNEGKPDPQCDLCSARPPIAPRSHPDSPPISPPESQGKGREGKGRKNLSDDSDEIDERFAEFWTNYPRKDAKAEARKAWKQITKKVDAQTVIDGLAAYAFSPDRKFVPLPSSWLRGQRWEDEGASVHQLPAANGPRRKQVQVGPDQWRDVVADDFIPIGSKTRWVSA